jgi:hypothetical protein
MITNVRTVGISFQDHRGWRTIGNRMTQANAARQKASVTAGQPSNQGAFAKKPLELQSRAASSTSQRPRAGDETNPFAEGTEAEGMGREDMEREGTFIVNDRS